MQGSCRIKKYSDVEQFEIDFIVYINLKSNNKIGKQYLRQSMKFQYLLNT